MEGRGEYMQLFDPKFKENKWGYIWQCVMATFCVGSVLMVLDALSYTAIIASLGATSFIAFMAPHIKASKPRYLIGGYICGTLSGVLCKLIALSPLMRSMPFTVQHEGVFFGAFAVGIAMFLMVTMNFEHPPAAGYALGIVLNDFNVRVLLVVMVGVVLIVSLKTVLKPYMKNLF